MLVQRLRSQLTIQQMLKLQQLLTTATHANQRCSRRFIKKLFFHSFSKISNEKSDDNDDSDDSDEILTHNVKSDPGLLRQSHVVVARNTPVSTNQRLVC